MNALLRIDASYENRHRQPAAPRGPTEVAAPARRIDGARIMSVFVFSFVFFVLVILALAAGVLLGRGALRPSCGGDSLVRPCGVCRARERR